MLTIENLMLSPKKNQYPISFIEKTLTQLEGTKYFTKIDI